MLSGESGVVAEHLPEHVKKPRAAAIGDEVIAERETRGVQALPESDGPGFGHAPVTLFLQQVVAIIIEDKAKGCGIFRFELEERAIAGHTFGDPLIAIAFPRDEVTPPLVRGLMGWGLPRKNGVLGTKVPGGQFVG